MNRFWTQPAALWLLALLPLVFALGWWANRRRQRDLARLASVPALAALLGKRPWRRRGRQLFGLLALLALIVGIAGPNWGRDAEQPVSQGRDLLVVLDLSRSMLAEQPSRQELARRALDDLADSLEKRGGHRVGLIVFAAQPKLIVPLTHDYDHFRERLMQQDAATPPLDIRPRGEEAISGTRIGAALKLALATFDAGSVGFQDILLVSDGDDPAGDEEWAQGAEEARQKGVTVYTVGVGDPETPSRIPGVEFAEKPVLSRLEEKPLKEIAQRTQGVYLPARRQPLPTGTLYRAVLEGQRPHEAGVAALPALRPQYRWFFGTALAFLACTLLLGEGKRMRAMLSRPTGTGSRSRTFNGRESMIDASNMLSRPLPTPQEDSGQHRPRKHGTLIMIIALVLISAAPAGRDPETLIREGNAAFARGEFDVALAAFEQAEERTNDPGLVAFNKAAALFGLKRYREAELSYIRSLEDQALPANRKPRAWHDLGTTLIHLAEGKDAAALERAINCFARCLADSNLDADLTISAEHNLELAHLQWIQAKAKEQPPQPKDPPGAGNDKQKGDGPNPPENEGPMNGGNQKSKASMQKSKPNKGGDKAIETDETNAGRGKIGTLADSDVLQPLDPEDALAHLDRAATRIQQDQRAREQRAPAAPPNVKDW